MRKAEFARFVARASVLGASVGLAALLSFSAVAQDKKPDTSGPAPAKDADAGKYWSNYDVHQSFDLGGHIVNKNGSSAMYATTVNMEAGPRILNHTLEMHAKPGSRHSIFDTLFEDSTGYGGDPYSFSTLRASRGRAYDFVGTFRRDRQFFDYNLWGNPLVPGGAAAPVSNGYIFPQVLDSTHFFNTVRRNTDLNFTFLPVSKISFRVGYNLNIMQGPSQSSLHQGADALLYQGWRNSTQTWLGAIDWKPVKLTTLTYEEHLVQYKGDTDWRLAGLNMQLPNGTPVTIGFDVVANPSASSATSNCGKAPAVLNSGTNPPTANPCVNGYTDYTRSSPTRTLFPTEEFRFQTSAIRNVQMTGRVLYTSATMKLDNYNEVFAGMESRVTAPAPSGAASWCTTSGGVKMDCHSGMTIAGAAKGQRIDFGADYGFVWQVSKDWAINEQFDYQNWREPALAGFLTTDTYSASMIAPPAVTVGPAPSSSNSFLGQKLTTNTVMLEGEGSRVQVGAGYRVRARRFALRRDTPTEAVQDPALLTYNFSINENTGIVDAVIRPSRDLRINASTECGWADAAYTQTDPRQFQRYQVHVTYKPRTWATLSGAFNDHEGRNGATLVDYRAHHRAVAATASLAPNEKFSLDMSYGYIDVFSTVVDCFDDSVPPPGATPLPIGAVCGNAVNTATSTAAYYGNSYYDAPTQYGSAALVWTPIKTFRGGFGYRVNDVQGTTQLLHPLAVPGTLRSRFQTPFVNLAYTFTPAWTMKVDYNYYGYGEDGPPGPTAPRNFHSNMYTLGMHYQF
jgi:hypothetical protein